MAISFAPRRRIVSSSRRISSVSPLYDSATTTSSLWMTPRSPWIASAGMQEERRRAGARQRRGDLPADDARLAHAGQDDAAAAAAAAARRRGRSARRAAATSARIAAASVSSTLRASAQISHAVSSGAAAGASARLTIASIAIRRRSSGSSRSRRSAFCASLLARAGSSCTSRKTPSTPAATPADASGSMYCAEPGRDAVAAARQLQAVRDVEHDRHALLAHHRKRAHVDDEVVVAEARAALGHDHARVAGVDAPWRPRGGCRRARGTGPS